MEVCLGSGGELVGVKRSNEGLGFQSSSGKGRSISDWECGAVSWYVDGEKDEKRSESRTTSTGRVEEGDGHGGQD